MFKPTQCMLGRLRRLPLTTKQARKGFYKGNGVGMLGTIDRYGRFTVDWNRVRTFVVPRDVDVCKLTPFVAESKSKNEEIGDMEWQKPVERLTGSKYLEWFKTDGNNEEYLEIQEEATRR
ncbi:hypothetical protein CC78DRAFT_499251 [Lojkania enalia]|uniref:Uncharacterized protein n=1 Tax=Lojkania enalia TaxID=147567 RepID=A0A9P4K3N4_9PLEO|nr:hypothetical protein CC78DRAFT_499251 [Didymosphaeria enalia]